MNEENVSVEVSRPRSAIGAMWPTIRHALTGFAAVASVKIFAILSPALMALEGGDFDPLLALRPMALLSVFVGGMIGAAAAAALRWLQFFFTTQVVVSNGK